MYWLIDHLSDWLIYWLIDRLKDWLIDWLILFLSIGACFALDFLDDVVASGGKDGVFKLWNDNLSKCLKTVTLENANLAVPSGSGNGGAGAGGTIENDAKGWFHVDP